MFERVNGRQRLENSMDAELSVRLKKHKQTRRFGSVYLGVDVPRVCEVFFMRIRVWVVQ